MKLKSKTGLGLASACAMLVSLSAAHGAVVESFESGSLNGWDPGTLNSVSTTVDSVRATDGSFSATNTFTVPASFSGWSANTIISKDPRTFMDAGTTTMTVDVYSDWTNPNGWGVYANTILLIMNNSNGWSSLAPTSGSLVNGSFSTLTWDMTSVAAAITDSGLGWSSVGFAWHVGTWAGGGDGLDNGTQTLALDNITVVPEPSSFLLLGFCGMGVMIRRKR